MSFPALTIEAVDALLLAWEERLRRMDENLIALEGDAAYQILAGKAGRRAPLLGVTEEQVYPALDAVTDLFEQRDALALVVTRARAARASISALTFWDRDEKLALVVYLLRARSIDRGVKSLPLAERGLLDEAERDVMVTPSALLEEMVRSFARARDVILAVSSAWKALTPAIEALQREIQALRALSGDADASDLAEASRELSALAGLVQKDPLGCLARPEQLKIPRLAALRSRREGDAATAESYPASKPRAAEQAGATRGAREELQGRLSARRAQTAVLAARAGIDPTPLEAWAREAERLLRAHPLSLAQATRAVETYEAAVLTLIRR